MNQHDALFCAAGSSICEIKTTAAGPAGRLPFTAETLRNEPSGNIFGLSQNAGMGWYPDEVAREPFLNPEHAR